MTLVKTLLAKLFKLVKLMFLNYAWSVALAPRTIGRIGIKSHQWSNKGMKVIRQISRVVRHCTLVRKKQTGRKFCRMELTKLFMEDTKTSSTWGMISISRKIRKLNIGLHCL